MENLERKLKTLLKKLTEKSMKKGLTDNCKTIAFMDVSKRDNLKCELRIGDVKMKHE